MSNFSLLGRRVILISTLAVLAGLLPGKGTAMERQVRPEHRENLTLTIYNQDLALVKDRRKAPVLKGLNELAFVGVSQRLRPETVIFAVLSEEADIQLLEQNFHYDALTAKTLLEKSLGRTIRIARINPATGEEVIQEAQVLSVEDGVLLRINDRIETIGFGDNHDFPGRLIFDRLPEKLRSQPTLVVVFESDIAFEESVLLSYLTGGMSWRADYVATLTPDERFLSLQGWATITNRSGSSYPRASVNLVAGDINVEGNVTPTQGLALMRSEAISDGNISPTELGDYHLYSLPRPTDIENNQTKQLALLARSGISVKKEYRVQGGSHIYLSRLGIQNPQPDAVTVSLEFENTREAGFSMPLPAGIVRVYTDSNGAGAQFIGEDRVGHTPEGNNVRLQLGRAFDVTVERRQTEYSDSGRGENRIWVYETAHEIILKNSKNRPVEVIVDEQIPGEWAIVSESAPHVKTDAATARWTMAIPARGETRLVYAVRVELTR